jgi:hypothetical protein
MSIGLQCIEQYFSCEYIYWHKIRNETIQATFDYLSIIFDLNKYKIEPLEIKYREKLEIIINELENNNIDKNYLNNFIKRCNNIETIDALIYFGVEGLFSLCNKRATEGFYSISDSHSICELFKLIKPFYFKNFEYIDSDENNIYNSIFELEKVFQESFEEKKIVTIL